MFISLKNKLKACAMVALTFAATSCEDEESKPVLTFDDAGKGAYARTIGDGETGDTFINLLEPDAFSYSVSLEFQDESKGTTVSQMVFDLVYEDNDASNGDNSTTVSDFLTLDASSFTDSEDGFKAVEFTVSASDIYTAAGINTADLSLGDEFDFIGKVVTNDGAEYVDDNSSASITGSAFRGYFGRTFPVTCPSTLEGEYSFTGTNFWCSSPDPATVNGTVEFISGGGGAYSMDDWSLGGYTGCYGGFVPASWGELQFTEVCEVVSFTGFVDGYGDTWTFIHSVDGEEWSITWSNTYGESGEAVITFPGGVPFTVE